jgi:hypothetical protein
MEIGLMQNANVTALKNRAYERMQQRKHTQNAVENYCVDRREEKWVHKKKKVKRRRRKRRWRKRGRRSQEYK